MINFREKYIIYLRYVRFADLFCLKTKKGSVLVLKLPKFKGKEMFVSRVNRSAEIAKLTETVAESFGFYLDFYLGEDYEIKEQRDNGVYRYAALKNGTSAAFLNYFYLSNELYIVCEENCNYFNFKDTCGEHHGQPQITQLSLLDYGMSYAIKLSDGRFILIDGGNRFERDVDWLWKHLKSQSPTEKPVIACWIMTHAHSDHFHAFIGMQDRYADEYVVQSFILNFMEIDDERFPGADKTDPRFSYNTSNAVNIPLMFEKIKETGAPVFMAHTGQIYNIGDAKIEMLSGLDETVDFMRANINATSLVFKMELGGQIILWTGDATFSEARLPQRYGDYIKSDIMQVPHHGFEGPIDPKVELEGYVLNNAETCFLPVNKNNAYVAIDTYHVGPRYLFQYADVEVITGEDEKTITLPYTPPAYRKLENRVNFRDGLAKSGATTWYFTGLNYENEEDVTFDILKTAGWVNASVGIQLIFFDKQKNLNMRISLKRGNHRINLADKESGIFDGNWESWNSLKTKGLEENGEFAVKFTSNIPIVISNKKHTAAYVNELRV